MAFSCDAPHMALHYHAEPHAKLTVKSLEVQMDSDFIFFSGGSYQKTLFIMNDFERVIYAFITTAMPSILVLARPSSHTRIWSRILQLSS